MNEKKKLNLLTKAKLIYSIELGVFAIIFLVLGVLKLTNVYNLSKKANWYVYVFLIVTLLGGVWFAIDFVWTLNSQKRRKKQPLIDKIILLPSSIATFTFDIYAFISGVDNIRAPLSSGNTILNYYTGALFIYFACIYIFQAIYHFIYPIPLLVEEIEEEIKKAELEEEKENKKEEENKQKEKEEKDN